MEKRYLRNIGTLTESGQKELCKKSVLVIGSGGLGGFVIEGLSRMGIQTIGICDFDVLDESNLNRQLLSTLESLGKSKVMTAKNRVKIIDEKINVITYEEKFPNDMINKDIENYDIVIDCLDSTKVRLELEEFCIKHNKKLIHGSVGGYYGTLAVISEENKVFQKYLVPKEDEDINIEKSLGNPYSIVAIIGAIQVNLAIEVLLNRKYLKKGFYYIDLAELTIEKVEF